MKDKKELLEQTIKEDLEKEAQEILKALETSDADKLSDEKQLELKKKIDKKIEDYEFEKICNELPEEYRDALRAGMELKKQEDSADHSHKQDEEKPDGNKKVVRKRKSLRVYVALAAVMTLLLVVGMSTMGDGGGIVETIKSLVGEREVLQVDSGEDNKVIEVETEEEAYQKIEKELGIKPVKLVVLPKETEFEKIRIEKDMKVAEFYYKYKGENIVYIINGDQTKNSIGIDREDEVIEQYSMKVKGITIEVEVQDVKELPMIDGSYLVKDEESIGATTPMTRGEDLMTGYSKVRRIGAGEIYAGGTTIASHTVDRIGVAVIVERAKEEDTSWKFYDGWQKFNENTDRVSTSKQLKVEGGYYYRVRCTHSAGNDLGSSFTNGVYVQTELGL